MPKSDRGRKAKTKSQLFHLQILLQKFNTIAKTCNMILREYYIIHDIKRILYNIKYIYFKKAPNQLIRSKRAYPELHSHLD